jgi:hypothetical protein
MHILNYSNRLAKQSSTNIKQDIEIGYIMSEKKTLKNISEEFVAEQ